MTVDVRNVVSVGWTLVAHAFFVRQSCFRLPETGRLHRVGINAHPTQI